MKYIPLQNFKSSSSDKEYAVSIDMKQSEEDNCVRLSCNCRGWIFSEKRNQKKGINHKTCKHTDTVSGILRGNYKKPVTELTSLILDSHQSMEEIFLHEMDDDGNFIRTLNFNSQKGTIMVLTRCPRCDEENECESNADIVECVHCGSEYCE